MRWNKKPTPKNNEIRRRRRFAFLPKRCQGDTAVWLEYYWRVDCYNSYCSYWARKPHEVYVAQESDEHDLDKEEKC